MVTLAVLALATYRVTRFLIHDTLIERPRLAVYKALGRHPKLIELLTCPWCLSIWISAGIVAVTDIWFAPIALPVWVWLANSAVTMLCWNVLDKEEPDELRVELAEVDDD